MRKRLSQLDDKISRRCALPPESQWWPWARLVAHVGDGPYVFGGLVVVYLLSLLWNDAYLQQADLIIAAIVTAAILAVTAVKFAVRRERPRPPGEFVTFQYDAYSFPSGHSGRMAALATSSIFFYPTLGLVLLVVALSVAAARVAVGVHYLGDILAGFGVGTLVACGGMLLLSIV
ncbi:MAG TPA: phosphatase PAP2 family protein [Anaerolineae bacterium]|nr:phosphatase PAP2 family protein [Anaerolineae bacterium]MCB0181018.1 phosphatase PAP2 family protein [Anaerolineae bacterium]MCB0225960.1 phosphatase PAP2 family protein [Anaerolineae bacterium]MCB9109176.1 phosphatase PAP2 family protein [Anaerolineales bacterium]HRV93550.1 phosphatase PAP2 family protein [Anaerolineae bacterium]